MFGKSSAVLLSSAILLMAQRPTSAEAYYTQGVNAWSKWYPAYAEARKQLGMKPEDTGPMPAGNVKTELKTKYLPIVEQGLQSLENALGIDSQYEDAMAFMELLTREAADLRDTKAEYDRDAATSDDWIQKAVEAKGRKTPPRIRLGSPVVQARLITKVDPTYPPVAAEAHVEGIVELEFGIDDTGHVKGIKVISGHSLLVRAAIDALSKWDYTPTMVSGDPVEIQGAKVTMTFPPGKEQ